MFAKSALSTQDEEISRVLSEAGGPCVFLQYSWRQVSPSLSDNWLPMYITTNKISQIEYILSSSDVKIQIYTALRHLENDLLKISHLPR